MAASFEKQGLIPARHSVLCCCLCFLITALSLNHFKAEITRQAYAHTLYSAHAFHPGGTSPLFAITSPRGHSRYVFQGILGPNARIPLFSFSALLLNIMAVTRVFQSNIASPALRPPN